VITCGFGWQVRVDSRTSALRAIAHPRPLWVHTDRRQPVQINKIGQVFPQEVHGEADDVHDAGCASVVPFGSLMLTHNPPACVF